MGYTRLIRGHVAIGWTAVAFGCIAIFLRLPAIVMFASAKISGSTSRKHEEIVRSCRRLMQWHSAFGMGYTLLVYFMPVTAIWIWPRYGTPNSVIGFITSMYASIIAGVVCIRVYKYANRSALLQQVELNATTASVVSPAASSSANNTIGPDDLHTVKISGETRGAVGPPQKEQQPILRFVWLKYLHGFFLLYSWAMLVGAGNAFTQNNRVGGFPYSQGMEIIDSLHGRCWGRDLQSPAAPPWLAALKCGDGPMCAESIFGGSNKYKQY